MLSEELSEECSEDDCSICFENVNDPNPNGEPKGPKIVLICGGRNMASIRHCVQPDVL